MPQDNSTNLSTFRYKIKDSPFLSGVTIRGGALTIYLKIQKGFLEGVIEDAKHIWRGFFNPNGPLETCGFKPVTGGDNHDVWHHPKTFTEETTHPHIHIVKTNDTSDFNPEDIKCITDIIKKFQQKNGYCQERGSDCYIPTEELNEITTEYEKFFETPKKQRELQEIAKLNENGAVWQTGKETLDTMVSAAGFSFFKTLFNYYIKPELVKKGYNEKTLDIAYLIMEKAAAYWLTGSLLSVAIPTLCEQFITPLLKVAGVTAQDQKWVLSLIHSGLSAITYKRSSILNNSACFLGAYAGTITGGLAATFFVNKLSPPAPAEEKSVEQTNDSETSNLSRKPNTPNQSSRRRLHR